MICPNCGAHIDDDSIFCAVCGGRISLPGDLKEEAAAAGDSAVQTENMTVIKGTVGAEKTAASAVSGDSAASAGTQLPVPDRKKNLPLKIIGLAAGTLFIIVGLMQVASAGTSISSTSFGADFYTYTYQGIVAVSDILASIELTLGWILAAIGTAIDIQALRS